MINKLIMMYGTSRVYATINSVTINQADQGYNAAVRDALDKQFRSGAAS